MPYHTTTTTYRRGGVDHTLPPVFEVKLPPLHEVSQADVDLPVFEDVAQGQLLSAAKIDTL